jgi:hypothetical protein
MKSTLPKWRNKRMPCRDALAEDWLNVLAALIFLGALIYFIATYQAELVTLGSSQQFCSCTPNTAITIVQKPKGSAFCVGLVQPTTTQQTAGQFFNFFLAGAFKGTTLDKSFGPCSVSDIPTATYNLADTEITFPQADMGISCLKKESKSTNSVMYFANVTRLSATLFRDSKIKQFFHFETTEFRFATFTTDYVFGPTDDYSASDCVLFLDARDWSSICTCPLDVIGDAVSVASVVIIILLPLRFYRLCHPKHAASDKPTDII